MVTYGNIDAQMKGMIESWGWTSSDVILHVLPLHHVHGVVNVLMTSLYTGATCKMMANFDAKQVNIGPVQSLYTGATCKMMANFDAKQVNIGPINQTFSLYFFHYFLTHQFKHVFRVLKRIISLRRFL